MALKRLERSLKYRAGRLRRLYGGGCLAARNALRQLRERRRAIRTPDEPRQILIGATTILGDLIMTAPLIGAVKQRHPRAAVTVAVLPGLKALAECINGADRAVELDPRNHSHFNALRRSGGGPWDLGIIVFVPELIPVFYGLGVEHIQSFAHPSGRYRRFIHCVRPLPEKVDTVSNMMLQLLDPPIDRFDLKPPYFRLPALELPDELKSQPYVVLHPGTRKRIKIWPASRYAQVADRLIRSGYRVAFTGSRHETGLIDSIRQQMKENQAVNLAGRTSLVLLAQVIRQARLVIGPDTGALHLARALDVCHVMLLGPSQPELFTASDMLHHVQKSRCLGLPGLSCRTRDTGFGYRIKGISNCYGDECPAGHHRCMDGIQAEAVLSAAAEFEHIHLEN